MIGTKTIATPKPVTATLKGARHAGTGLTADGAPVSAYRLGRTVLTVIEHKLGVEVVAEVFDTPLLAARAVHAVGKTRGAHAPGGKVAA